MKCGRIISGKTVNMTNTMCENTPCEKISNEALYWYQYHLKGTGVGTGIDTQPYW